MLEDRGLQRGTVNVGGNHPGRIGIGVGVDHGRRVKTPDPPRRVDLPREPLTELLAAGVPEWMSFTAT